MKELRRAIFFVPDEFDEHEVIVRYAPQSESPGHTWEVCNPTEKDPTVRITIYEQRSMAQRYEYSICKLDLDSDQFNVFALEDMMNKKAAQGWRLVAAGRKLHLWERPLDERVEIPVSGQGVPQDVIERMRKER